MTTDAPQRSCAPPLLLALPSLNAALLAPAQARAEQPLDILTPVVVTAPRIGAESADQLSVDRLTQPLVDTPQSITSLPASEIADRGAVDLNDVLRMAPGITLGAGETSWQGNNAYLRGFTTRQDMFIDGQRDFDRGAAGLEPAGPGHPLLLRDGARLCRLRGNG